MDVDGGMYQDPCYFSTFHHCLFLYYYRNILKGNEPVYQIVWAEPEDFKEVLISPVMLQDHMPDQVLSALKKVK